MFLTAIHRLLENTIYEIEMYSIMFVLLGSVGILVLEGSTVMISVGSRVTQTSQRQKTARVFFNVKKYDCAQKSFRCERIGCYNQILHFTKKFDQTKIRSDQRKSGLIEVSIFLIFKNL